MSHTTVVSTDLLARHLESWTVVDCRFDLQDEHWGRHRYLEAHIPGASYASLHDDLSGPRDGMNGRHPLPSVDSLAAAVGRLGINRDAQVVVYDQDAGLFASRLWWSLRYLGHTSVAVLDGGWAKWVREGRPTRAGDERRAATTFTADPRPDMRLSVDAVAAQLGRTDLVLIDARGPERFEGRSEPLDRIAGHIPGAVNHYYKWNLAEDDTLLPPEQLRASLGRALGGGRPETAIMYCGSGVSACHNLLAMEHAGLAGGRLYVGSWSEWSADPTRPVETGPSRR